MTTLTVLIAADQMRLHLAKYRWFLPAAVGVCAVHLAIGLWLRTVETTRTRELQLLAIALCDYEATRPVGGYPGSMGAVLGGD